MEAGIQLTDSGNDFLVSFLFNFGLCVLMLIGFILARPHLAFFYSPNVQPGAASDAPDSVDTSAYFSWIKPTFNTPLTWFQQHRGLDSYLYLQFLRACAQLFFFTSVLGLIVIIPTNYSGTNKDLDPADHAHIEGLEVISMANIAAGSSLLYGTIPTRTFVSRSLCLQSTRCAPPLLPS